MDQCRQKGEDEQIGSALSDIAFLAAVDGEADEETEAYLREHPLCAQEVELTREIQTLLHTRLYRLFCPSSDILTKHRLGMLDSEQSKALADHIALCPNCAQELGMLERIIGDTNRPDRKISVRPAQ